MLSEATARQGWTMVIRGDTVIAPKIPPTQKREDYTSTLASPFFPFPSLPLVLPLVETSQTLLPGSLGNVVPSGARSSGKGGESV